AAVPRPRNAEVRRAAASPPARGVRGARPVCRRRRRDGRAGLGQHQAQDAFSVRQSLRVAMLTPAFWPEIRRGTERAVHEISTGLIARGHRPQVITSHPGRPARGTEEGVPVLRVPRPPDGRLLHRGFEYHVTHVPFAYAALRAGGYDVAHAWFTTDALAAARWRRVT